MLSFNIDLNMDFLGQLEVWGPGAAAHFSQLAIQPWRLGI